MRRLAALLAFTLLALAAPATASAADVSVIGPRGGDTTTVSLESLAASFDINATYDIVGTSGRTTTQPIHGISLGALLDAVDADPTYGAVQIVRPGGGFVQLSRAQIEASGKAPVIYTAGGTTNFVRPSYRSGDRNANDVVSVTGAPLQIRQVDTSPYKVTVNASKTKARTGEQLSFSAAASGAGAGQKLTYSWQFDDGAKAGGQSVKHTFKQRGSYAVLVTVRGEGEKTSSPAVVRVQIGKAAASKKKRSGGGTNDSTAAPSSGQADGGSGSGTEAGSAAAAPTPPATKPPKKHKRAKAASSDEIEVRGQLLDVQTVAPQQNTLAARSGKATKKPQSSGSMPAGAAGAAGTLGLLGLGMMLEMGGLARLRRRLSVG